MIVTRAYTNNHTNVCVCAEFTIILVIDAFLPYSPPLPHQNFSNYFFADSEVQNLAHLGSVPNDGIKQVRIHWLLDLVTAK